MKKEADSSIHMAEEEERRRKRAIESKEFVNYAIKQCKKANFTIRQFRQVTDILCVKLKILKSYAEDTVRMGDEDTNVELKDEVFEIADELIKQCQQHNFTISQFEWIIESFDFKRQLLEMSAANTVKMRD